jgi:hypothetical protein
MRIINLRKVNLHKNEARYRLFIVTSVMIGSTYVTEAS